jgi:hypothetical protein
MLQAETATADGDGIFAKEVVPLVETHVGSRDVYGHGKAVNDDRPEGECWPVRQETQM